MRIKNTSRLTSLSFALVVASGLLLSIGCEDEEQKGATASKADIEAGEKIFESKCMSCHTVGEGDRIGPDLAGVHERREKDWLVRWIEDPMGMSQNDPIGKKLFEEFDSVPMPPQGLSSEEIEQVLAYIKAQSGKASSGQTAEQEAVERTETRLANVHNTARDVH